MSENINYFKYKGRLAELMWLYVVVTFLLLITIFVYWPWARMRIRRYVIGNTYLNNTPLCYTGTMEGALRDGLHNMHAPRQLLRGVAQAAAVLRIADMILPSSIIDIILKPYAIYNELRYHWAHIFYKNLNCNLNNVPPHNFAIYTIANYATLGLFAPYFNIKKQQFLSDNMQVGSTPVTFNGHSSALYKIHVLTLLLLLIVPFIFMLYDIDIIVLLVASIFCVSRAWYVAAFKNYIYAATTIGHVRIQGNYSAKDVAIYYMTNLFVGVAWVMLLYWGLWIATLPSSDLFMIVKIVIFVMAAPFAVGVFFSIIKHKSSKFHCSRVRLLGDLSALPAATPAPDIKTGEGVG